MRRVRSTLSDSDNIAISVQVKLELEWPTGTELGNSDFLIIASLFRVWFHKP